MSSTISIRMYNVGFGDCFLVTIPGQNGLPTRILFDCGSVALPPAIDMQQVLTQLWNDATDPGAAHPRIDVVVGTHRHRDHVSGFAVPGWEKVQVKEVWLPWTEHPTDEQARLIRERQSRLALALDRSLGARLNMAGLSPTERPRIEQWLELARNALSNERAMTTLHHGFAGNPKRRFFPDPNATDLAIETEALPGITAFVLGPSRDKDVIRDMDPPAGKSYLRLMASMEGKTTVPPPFGPDWVITPEAWADASKIGPTEKEPSRLASMAKLLGALQGLTTETQLPYLSPEDQKAISETNDLEQAVAVSLDKAVNGTSLMIVLQVGQAHLLFPGDAQWGTWQAALRNPAARDLLARTRFFKVGHHGSHNATPKEFVEELIKDRNVTSMISTRAVAQWPEIPRTDLLTALTTCGCKWARSDDAAHADAGIFHANGDLFVDLSVPSTD